MHAKEDGHVNATGKRLVGALLINILITLIQFVGGIYASSLALISDALHNLSDVFAILISYFGYKLSEAESSEKRTFGLKRAEVFAALINAVILLILSTFLFKEGFERIIRPAEVREDIILVVGFLGLAGNAGSMLLLYERHRKSLNLYSAFLHMFADALSSLGVIMGAIIIRLTGLDIVDSLLSFVIAGYVIYQSFGLLSESMRILMQVAPKHIDIQEIKKEIESLKGVENVHHVHLWALTESELYFEAHVELKEDLPLSAGCTKISAIEKILKEKFGINHATIQLEYKACEDRSLVRKIKKT